MCLGVSHLSTFWVQSRSRRGTPSLPNALSRRYSVENPFEELLTQSQNKQNLVTVLCHTILTDPPEILVSFVQLGRVSNLSRGPRDRPD